MTRNKVFIMRCFTLLLLLVSLEFFGPIAPAFAQEKEAPDREDLKGRLRVELETGGHFSQIFFAQFTRDDRRLVTVGYDHTIQIWHLASGQRLRKLELPVLENVHCAALTPDDRTLAISVEGWNFSSKGSRVRPAILLINLEDGRFLPLSQKTGPRYAVYSALAFSPKGDQLAAGAMSVLHLWDNMDKVWSEAVNLPLEKQIDLLTPRVYPARPASVTRVAFAPDGGLIAVGDNDVHGGGVLWETAAGGEKKPGVKLKKVDDQVFGLCWSADGQTLFTGGRDGDSIRQFDRSGKRLAQYTAAAAAKKKFMTSIPGHARVSYLHALDGNTLLAAGSTHLGSDPNTTPWNAFAYQVNLEEGTFKQCIRELDQGGYLSRTAVSHDGRRAVTTVNAGRNLLLWNIADGKVVRRFGGKAQTPVRVAWLKNDRGRHVLAWGYGRDPRDPNYGKLTRAFDLDRLQLLDQVNAEDFSGRLHEQGPWSIAYQSKNSSINVRLRNGTQTAVLTQRGDGISAFTLVPQTGGDPLVAFAPAGRSLSLADGAGKTVHSFGFRFRHVLDIAPSTDGKYLAVATGAQRIIITSSGRDGRNHLHLYVAGSDWVVWHNRGYFAASPGGERLMGWVVSDSVLKHGTFHPAARFHKKFYRPDVISRVLTEESFNKALSNANKAAGKGAAEDFNLEDNLPPSVAIESVDTSKLPAITVRASASAAGKRDPLKALELLVDGRPLYGAAGVYRMAAPQAGVTRSWSVEVPPGAHRLSVRVHSVSNLATSAPAAVTWTPPPKVAARLPKATLRVLAIGINDYQKHPGLKLSSAVNDAHKLVEVLKERCGLPLYREVVGEALPDNKATVKNILRAIDRLDEEAKPSDVVVVFFAGHGVKSPDGGLYLLTHEADLNDLEHTALKGDVLRQKLARLQCRVLLMLDACHAAAFDPGKRPREVKDLKPAADDLARELADDDCGVVVWCAALTFEKAQEDSKKGHGLFTYAFLEALQQDRYYNEDDHKVYLYHLHAYMADRVLIWSGRRQHPHLVLPGSIAAFALRQLPPKLKTNPGR